MLAELSAANAAFAVIKTAVQNSGDLLKAGQAIADFVNAKDSLHYSSRLHWLCTEQ